MSTYANSDPPDANSNGQPINAVTALCNALGYTIGTVAAQWPSVSSGCAEVHALDAMGQTWSSDYVESANAAYQYTCSNPYQCARDGTRFLPDPTLCLDQCPTGFWGVTCNNGLLWRFCSLSDWRLLPECPGGNVLTCSQAGTCSQGVTGTGVWCADLRCTFSTLLALLRAQQLPERLQWQQLPVLQRCHLLRTGNVS